MIFGLLEMHVRNHYPLIDSWIEVLRHRGHEVVLFTVPEVAKVVRSDLPYRAELKRPEESASGFLARVACYPVDRLVIISLQTHLLQFLRFRPRAPVYLTIHNARTWFVGNRGGLKDLVKQHVRRTWLRRASVVVVNSTNMRDFVRAHGTCRRPLHVMPFSVYSGPRAGGNAGGGGPLLAVVPGGIAKNRKRYEELLFAIPRVRKVRFVFLGAPDPAEGGTEIVARLDALRREGADVEYFTSYVDPATFDARMDTCDLIVGNLHVAFRSYDYEEIYGLSKDSGISYLMVKHSKPGLLPRDFRNLVELESSSLYYGDGPTLAEALASLAGDRAKLADLTRSARANSERFGVDAVCARLEEIL